MAAKNSAAEIQHFKERIQVLEKEVADYKMRLADLRKAKNQVIHKREREIVEVKTPFQRRSSDIGPRRHSQDGRATKDAVQVSYFPQDISFILATMCIGSARIWNKSAVFQQFRSN